MARAGPALLAAGAALAALAAAAALGWPALFARQLHQMLVVTNESMSFELWRETPIPMYLELFMFNLSNAREILAGGDLKPQLHQLGPYVFRELHVKTNLTWNDHNSTITFYNNRTWHYVPEMSNGSLDDNVTNINVVVATVAYSLRLEPLLVRPVVDALLLSMHESIFVTAPVREWLFEGIEDPIIKWAVDNDIPLQIPFDRFGWFYERNGSETFDGQFNMRTGADDIGRLGEIASWNGFNRTPFFREECADVRGSTGELWPPESDQDELTLFASDICTYLTLARDQDVSVLGISGVRYVANNSVFDNGYRYPDMACYCAEQRDKECVLPGALNASSCRLGAPAFVSFPHFYLADPYYLSKVDGLQPNKSAHEFYVELELFTGIPLQVRAQLQINVLIRRVPGMSIANVLPEDTLMPMFWLRQEVQLTPEYAAQARLALNLRYGVLYALYALAAAGAALLGAGVCLLIRRALRVRDQPLLEPVAHADE